MAPACLDVNLIRRTDSAPAVASFKLLQSPLGPIKRATSNQIKNNQQCCYLCTGTHAFAKRKDADSRADDLAVGRACHQHHHGDGMFCSQDVSVQRVTVEDRRSGTVITKRKLAIQVQRRTRREVHDDGDRPAIFFARRFAGAAANGKRSGHRMIDWGATRAHGFRRYGCVRDRPLWASGRGPSSGVGRRCRYRRIRPFFGEDAARI